MPRTLENKLTAALAPTQAPDELWARVDAALSNPSRSGPPWPRLAMAAALAALMSGGVLYLRAQATAASSPFAVEAVNFHRQAASTAPDSSYAVQRYTFEGQPVTVVSAPEPGTPNTKKLVHATSAGGGGLAVSEWTSQGRRWAMVSTALTHRQACSVCHRA